MDLRQKIGHYLGTLAVLVGIIGSPVVSHFIPANISAIIVAVGYAIKQLTAPGSLFGPPAPAAS